LKKGNTYQHLSDEQLLRAYRDTGDSEWLGIALQRYTLLLLGVALKYLKDPIAAEDAVQQVFLKVLTHFPKEDIQNFKGWLYVLTRNHCLQELRHKDYTASVALTSQWSEVATDHDDILWREQTLEQMEEAIGMLNDEQKKSITLFYLKRMSYDQVIAATGYTFTQVKSYIQNGKRNLKNILTKKMAQRK
jgi:RNA polymerase sigma factor (sigma-70 family)